MKTKPLPLKVALVILAWLSAHNSQLSAAPLGTAFTYQGRLNDGGQSAQGGYDLRFTIYDHDNGGSPLVEPLTNAAVAVSDGLFTVTLDFGSGVFDGNARWLEIAVRTNGSSEFTALNPRQPITPTPYAQYAPVAGWAATAASAGSVMATNIAGTISPTQLPGIVLTNNQAGVTLIGGFNAAAGLVIENRTNDPPSPAVGRIWLRTDL